MNDWIRLANLQLPRRLANALLDRFVTPGCVFSASAPELSGTPGITLQQVTRILDPSFVPTSGQLDYIEKRQVQIVPKGADSFPRNLNDIPDAPPVLFVRGNLFEKDRFAVAIVGSRHASPYGRSVTGKLARDLSTAGLTVVSGGAIGIDSAAHRSTVDARGRTIVVLGCGLDVEYPKENQGLFDQIVSEDRGALISEFPMGSTPEAWHFPMRNRIVSGLAMGVVVVEAGRQSGALLTAGIAAEQGRDVMAVPGNVDRPGCKGTNGLIRDGATLVEDARDVLQALGILALESPSAEAASRLPEAARNVPPEQKKLLENLSLTPKHIDALSADVNIPPIQVSVQMTMLELSGLVRRLPGNCYIRVL
jgi:DNA processing protein